MKYPKFFLFFITVIIAYLIFINQEALVIQNLISSLGYVGAFLAGILYVYSFSAAIATSLLLILGKQNNILLVGLIAGLGALCGDLVIYKFIRHSFHDELDKLKKEPFIVRISKSLHGNLKKYIMPVLAMIVIASPLPDEIGVVLLASSKVITLRMFSILAYVLNTLGIFIILIIGNVM